MSFDSKFSLFALHYYLEHYLFVEINNNLGYKDRYRKTHLIILISEFDGFLQENTNLINFWKLYDFFLFHQLWLKKLSQLKLYLSCVKEQKLLHSEIILASASAKLRLASFPNKLFQRQFDQTHLLMLRSSLGKQALIMLILWKLTYEWLCTLKYHDPPDIPQKPFKLTDIVLENKLQKEK